VQLQAYGLALRNEVLLEEVSRLQRLQGRGVPGVPRPAYRVTRP
jgi:hypothetical protein